jgi:hypothetical protein
VVAIHLEYTVLEGVLRRRLGVAVCNDLEHFLEMWVFSFIHFALLLPGTGADWGIRRIGLREEAEWVSCYVEDSESWGLAEGEMLGGGRAFNHSAVYWRKKRGDEVEEVVKKLNGVSIYSLRITSARCGIGENRGSDW